MLKLKQNQIKEVQELLKNDTAPASPDSGLFILWDYLEDQGYQDHQIQEYITQKGDWLLTRTMLMELTGI